MDVICKIKKKKTNRKKVWDWGVSLNKDAIVASLS